MIYKIKADNGELSIGTSIGPPHTVAHDLLEHVNGINMVDTTLRDKLMALGGCWFVRGPQEYERVSKALRKDLGNLLFEYAHSDQSIKKYIMLEKSREYRQILALLSQVSIKMNSADSKDKRTMPDQTTQVEFWQLALRYVVLGYNKALRRFMGNQPKAYTLFYAVQGLLEKHQDDGEINLRISFRHLDAEVLDE